MSAYIISPTARADLASISEYIARENSEDRADQVLRRLSADMQKQADMPGIRNRWRPGDAGRCLSRPGHAATATLAGLGQGRQGKTGTHDSGRGVAAPKSFIKSCPKIAVELGAKTPSRKRDLGILIVGR